LVVAGTEIDEVSSRKAEQAKALGIMIWDENEWLIASGSV
jgi:NAD-dependent DNA ligase